MTRRTRRRFLAELARTGTGALIAGGAVACGGPSRERIAEMAAAYDPDLVCDDLSGLWPAETATRETNEYTDRSSRDDQYCFICANFVPPKQPRSCGTCRTVKGPVSPLGWCKSWTLRQG